MTSPVHSNLPALVDNGMTTLVASDGTAAKVLIEPQAPAAAGATSPLLFGGCAVIDITAASTDAAAKDLNVWHGKVLTTVGGATGAVVTTTSSIPRTIGSFIADGFKPGDLAMVFNDPTQSRQPGLDGVLGIVTAVSALALTLHGTPLAAVAVTAGARICRMSYDARVLVPASAGTNGASRTVAMIASQYDGSILSTHRNLAANELLAVSAVAAVSALPSWVNVGAQIVRY